MQTCSSSRASNRRRRNTVNIVIPDCPSNLQLLHMPREGAPGNMRASSLISNVGEWIPVDESNVPFKVNLGPLPTNSHPEAGSSVACLLPTISERASVFFHVRLLPSFDVHRAHMRLCHWTRMVWLCSFSNSALCQASSHDPPRHQHSFPVS
jgi:hypothetical protein